jgi:hypothetical protein
VNRTKDITPFSPFSFSVTPPKFVVKLYALIVGNKDVNVESRSTTFTADFSSSSRKIDRNRLFSIDLGEIAFGALSTTKFRAAKQNHAKKFVLPTLQQCS